MPTPSSTALDLPTAEEAPTVSIEVASRALGISVSRGYQLARAGNGMTDGVPIIRIGQRYRVPTAPLRRLLGLV